MINLVSLFSFVLRCLLEVFFFGILPCELYVICTSLKIISPYFVQQQLQQSDSSSKKTLVKQNDGTWRHLKYKIRSSNW